MPIGIDDVGHIDAVLLSHDHHKDNLDAAGRAFLATSAVDAVFTTKAALPDPTRWLELGEAIEL